MGVPRNIMRALCAVIWPDHFKFASYGPELPRLSERTVASLNIYYGKSAAHCVEEAPSNLHHLW